MSPTFRWSSTRGDSVNSLHRVPTLLRSAVVPRAAQPVTMSFSFDPFDRDVFRVLMDAQTEAKKIGASSVGTDHLLLAATMQRDGVKKACESVGLTASLLRAHLRGGRGMPGLDSLFSQRDELLPFGKDTEATLKAVVKSWKKDTLIPWADLIVGVFEYGGDSSRASIVLQELKINKAELLKAIQVRSKGELVGAGGEKSGKSPTLDEATTDLTEKAREGKLDPVIGRDDEIIRTMKILARRRKNNPILLGDPGVGKTAIAEGLAQRIADGNVPQSLIGSRVMSLELGMLVAGTKYRGEFEEKLTSIIEEVTKNDDIILFIDEIHNLVGAGAAEGGLDGANVMKPSLARGDLQVVGATTITEYRQYFEKDAALERRFQPVKVDEPTVEQTIEILQGLSKRYEKYHNVTYSPEALEAATKLSARYVQDRFLPDKAIDLLDEAGASVGMGAFLQGSEAKANPIVDEEDMAEVISEWTGIPISKLTDDDAKSMLNIESKLHERVIGQDFAVSAIARALRRARIGLRSARRPVASMIFCGPTGVGKTELAKAVAESYYGDEKAMVRLDMSEYMEAFSVSRLTGPPPGYVGYEAGGQLTEAVRRNPHTVVLFDEIEKAHPDVFNALLQVLDDGRLTDNKGRTIDFSNTMIILTSNVGSRKILSMAQTDDGAADKTKRAEMHVAMRQAAKAELGKAFRPEFLNRLDEVIVFEALSQDNVLSVAGLMLKELVHHCKEQNLELTTTQRLNKVLAKVGFSSTFGARPLRRAMQRMCEDAVAEAVLEGFVNEGEKLQLDHDEKDSVIVINQAGKKRSHVPPLSQGIEEELPVAEAPKPVQFSAPMSSY